MRLTRPLMASLLAAICLPLVLSAEETADTATAVLSPSNPWVGLVLWSFGAILLLILEALFVSGGIFGLVALVLAVMAGIDAFAISPFIGWVYLLMAPLIGIWIIYWGFKRMPDSPLAARSELSEKAGYHWHAAEMGIEVGSTATLLSDARPDARARFPGGVIDVNAESGTIPVGSHVRVVAITGTGITVVRQSDQPVSNSASSQADESSSPPSIGSSNKDA